MSQALNSPLSLFRTYRNAILESKKTSRSSNSNWFRSAAELPVQWHLSIDGDTIISAVWRKKEGKWVGGPPLTLEQLVSPKDGFIGETIKAILGETIGSGKEALGVILHLHNHFQIAEIRSEFSNEDESSEILDQLVRLSPETSIAGNHIDSQDFSYSLLPYWGSCPAGRTAVAIKTSNVFTAITDQLTIWGENHNTPVKVLVTSAPLQILSNFLSTTLKDTENSPNDGRILVLRSLSTTFIVVLNEEGELCSTRLVINPAKAALPQNLNQLIVNCGAAVNIQNAEISLIDLASQAPLSREALDGLDFKLRALPVKAGIPLEFLNESNIFSEHPEFRADIPAENRTFSELRASWADRNLYTLACQDPTQHPSQRALQLLNFSQLIRKVLTMVIPAAIGWCSMAAIEYSQEDYSKISKGTVDSTSNKVKALSLEKKEIIYWESLTDSRSEGWIALSALLDLFPEDQGVVLTGFSVSYYGLAPEKRAKRLPMEQKWRAKGHATLKGIQYLVGLSSKSTLSRSFERISDWSDSPLYSVSEGSRDLRVTLDQRQDVMSSNSIVSGAVARHFLKGFEIEIDRSFSDVDQIALVISPPKMKPEEDPK